LKSFHMPVLGRGRYPCIALEVEGLGLMCNDKRIPCNQLDEVDRSEFYKNSKTCYTATDAMRGLVPREGCEYYLAVQKANQAHIAIMTMDYLLAISNNNVYRTFIKREVLAIDEAHRVPSIMRKYHIEQMTESLFFWNEIIPTFPDAKKYEGHPDEYWRMCRLWLVGKVKPIAEKKLEEKRIEIINVFSALHDINMEINRAVASGDKELEWKKRKERSEILKEIKEDDRYDRYKQLILDRDRCEGTIAKVERIIPVKTDFVVVREYRKVRGIQHLKSVSFIPL
ncbi:unnamed protein product, partial [marine sediment metagenome]